MPRGRRPLSAGLIKLREALRPGLHCVWSVWLDTELGGALLKTCGTFPSGITNVYVWIRWRASFAIAGTRQVEAEKKQESRRWQVFSLVANPAISAFYSTASNDGKCSGTRVCRIADILRSNSMGKRQLLRLRRTSFSHSKHGIWARGIHVPSFPNRGVF